MSKAALATKLEDLVALRDEFAAKLETSQCSMAEATSWGISEGKLSHKPPAFFDVVGVQVGQTQRLLVQQNESAVVILVQTLVDGERHYLISARAEPGLLKKCVITSTIQSTPSNLNRVHGGRATSYYDFLVDRSSPVIKIFESREFDYGFIYTNKHKSFQILQVPEMLETDESFAWVSESVLVEAMRQDNLIGTDLRVLLAKYLLLLKHNLKPELSAGKPSWSQPIAKIENLENWQIFESGIEEANHQQGFAVKFFRTSSPSREKVNWVQPLLDFTSDGRCGFWVASNDEGTKYGVGQNNEIGISYSNVLNAAILNYPGFTEVENKPKKITDKVVADFEGGRFFETQYEVVLAEFDIDDETEEIHWKTELEIAQCMVKDFETTVEFRLAASLLLN
jgi:NDP-hexose 2,3-dehydratase